MLTHGENVSFKEWAEEEGKSHGDVPLMDWAEHEEESHDARYGAESFEADEDDDKDHEEFLNQYHESVCRICARPYEWSRIARALVQH